MKPEETVDYHFKVCWHAISRMYNAEAVKNDMTTSIGFVLLNIDQQQGTPATKIAPLLGLEARSLTRILKSMEEKDFIYKVSDPSDKRLVRIFLTEKGLQKKEVARNTVKLFNKRVHEELPQQELDVFFSVCGRILSMIERKEIFKP